MPEDSTPAIPDWDEQQLEVILADRNARQLVIAGPGEGKTAVACQRIAYLIEDGVTASRILMISFTRTAVQEIRNRIITYAPKPEDAQTVKISTLDSHAWSLRYGFDDTPLPRLVADDSYDANIEKTVELFQERTAELLDFMGRFEHVVIDEAQDIVGIRAALVVELLKSLKESCGITIFADPMQAIYGFTTEEQDSVEGQADLLKRLEDGDLPSFERRTLGRIYRLESQELKSLFEACRAQVAVAEPSESHLPEIQRTITERSSAQLGDAEAERVARELDELGPDGLVLLRRRADVLLVSSYCSSQGIEHRLRLSALPMVVRPWVGCLFHHCTSSMLSRQGFAQLWATVTQEHPKPFEGEGRDGCWTLLHRFAAGKQSNTVDIPQLRRVVGRHRPPIEFCYQEFGWRGPILGTIHASKGREAPEVLLITPKGSKLPEGASPHQILEEGRVLYVGATRARRRLLVADGRPYPTGYLTSGRAYRWLGPKKVQLEFGREGDVDLQAHFAWDGSEKIHRLLADSVGQSWSVNGLARSDWDFATRLFMEHRTGEVSRVDAVGHLSPIFGQDLKELWRMVGNKAGSVKPTGSVKHLYLFGVTTVALSESERMEMPMPYNRQSGFGLAPLIKGFSVVSFRSYTPKKVE